MMASERGLLLSRLLLVADDEVGGRGRETVRLHCVEDRMCIVRMVFCDRPFFPANHAPMTERDDLTVITPRRLVPSGIVEEEVFEEGGRTVAGRLEHLQHLLAGQGISPKADPDDVDEAWLAILCELARFTVKSDQLAIQRRGFPVVVRVQAAQVSLVMPLHLAFRHRLYKRSTVEDGERMNSLESDDLVELVETKADRHDLVSGANEALGSAGAQILEHFRVYVP